MTIVQQMSWRISNYGTKSTLEMWTTSAMTQCLFQHMNRVWSTSSFFPSTRPAWICLLLKYLQKAFDNDKDLHCPNLCLVYFRLLDIKQEHMFVISDLFTIEVTWGEMQFVISAVLASLKLGCNCKEVRTLLPSYIFAQSCGLIKHCNAIQQKIETLEAGCLDNQQYSAL